MCAYIHTYRNFTIIVVLLSPMFIALSNLFDCKCVCIHTHTGNINLIYSIIRSKAVFYQLANLPEDSYHLVKPKRSSREQDSAGLPRVPLEGEGVAEGQETQRTSEEVGGEQIE